MEKLPRTISYLAPLLNKKNSIIIMTLLAVSSLSFLHFWNWNSILTIKQKNLSTYSNNSLAKLLTDFAITKKHQRLVYNETLDKNSPYFGLIYVLTARHLSTRNSSFHPGNRLLLKLLFITAI